MLQSILVENFRSITSCRVDLAPITVFFGPTSAGKSSLFYAILVLRNFILNPNQTLDGLFNLGFQNLGGLDACIFDHVTSTPLTVIATVHGGSSYGIHVGKAETEIVSDGPIQKMQAKVAIPYGASQSWSFTYQEGDEEYLITWNGFVSTVSPKSQSPEGQARATKLAETLNYPLEMIKRGIDVCPHRRGFFKPSYSPAQVTPTPTTEDEVATLIITDQNLPARISIDTEEIFDRDFRVHTLPGTATTYLQTTERKGARIPGLLVNDGFGVNQVVYMLAKIHRPDVNTVLIEEPEVHLHPTVIRNFARVSARLATEQKKQLCFTTHSEQFILSLLACVREGILRPDDLRCYYVQRERRETTFTHEPVSPDGQIAGGLSSFVEAELQDIRTFLSAKH